MNKIFLTTERLILREITLDDFEELAEMLQEIDVMYAWEYAFSDEEVRGWIEKCRNYYEKFSLGYFLAIEKESKKVVGQIALMPDNVNGEELLEVGYILKKNCWGLGYAQEGARAMIKYAFEELKRDKVIAEIRPNNQNSRNVAERLGMGITGEFVKNVRGKNMPHLIYSLNNPKQS